MSFLYSVESLFPKMKNIYSSRNDVCTFWCVAKIYSKKTWEKFIQLSEMSVKKFCARHDLRRERHVRYLAGEHFDSIYICTSIYT